MAILVDDSTKTVLSICGEASDPVAFKSLRRARDAATVHAVRRKARGWAARSESVTGKAYWAVGRTGLG